MKAPAPAPGRGAAAKARAFRKRVLAWYAANRRDFPWRETREAWPILVSEVMLQQTQTERVVPKYLAFLEAFPDPESLAKAPTAQLLRLWSGLGYNRRALALKRAAEEIAGRLGGRVPDLEESLLSLPGVGPYTASAVLAFAFDRPVVLLETNVRAAFLHDFFPGREGVRDAELLPLVALALDRDDPRNWYYALMDYGAMLKRSVGNPNRRSAHHARQEPFAGSNRRLRGGLLKLLAAPGAEGGLGLGALESALPFSGERVGKALRELVAEGFVEEEGGRYLLDGSGGVRRGGRRGT